jgi:hypothetical protein
MAIVYPRMPCAACRKPIVEGEHCLPFPYFTDNELDPIYSFNDAAAHFACVQTSEFRQSLEYVRRTVLALPPPAMCPCVITGKLIAMSDFAFTGYLVGNSMHSLFPFNFVAMSKTAFVTWEFRGRFVQQIRHLAVEGLWSEQGVRRLLREFGL